jgi:YfiH family protein
VRVELTHARVLFSGQAEGDLGRTNLLASSEVLAHRDRLLALCGLPAVTVGRQVHASSVAIAQADAGYVVDGGEADGQATRRHGVGVGVHVADCLPIAVAGEGGVVMLHCGWRGLASGIVGEGVRTLRAIGVEGPLEAAIGPGAGGCCYETGPEVHASFASYGASDGRLLDLGAIAAAQLREAGVAGVIDVGLCTLCAEGGVFFSHRRDGPDGGRQGGFAWLR